MKTFISKFKFWRKSPTLEKKTKPIISNGANYPSNTSNTSNNTIEEDQFRLSTNSSHYNNIPITTGPITKSTPPSTTPHSTSIPSEHCSTSQSFTQLKIIETLFEDQNNNSNTNNNIENVTPNPTLPTIHPRVEIPPLNFLNIHGKNNLSNCNSTSSLSPNTGSTASSNNNNINNNNLNNLNKEDESPRSHSYLGIRNLFSTSPRNTFLQKSPRNNRSSSIFSNPFVNNSNNNNNNNNYQQYNSNNIQNLPQHLIEDILYNCMDFLLPSLNYIEMCTVSKCFHRVIDSMRGFILIIGITDSQSQYAIHWYQKNYKKVAKIKFVNDFFKTPNPTSNTGTILLANQISNQFLYIFQNTPHDPSLDLSDCFIPPELLIIISQKLLINDCFMELNLSKTTSSNQDYIQNEVFQFFKSLSYNNTLTNLQLNQSTFLLPNQQLISSSLDDIHRIGFLDLGNLNISHTVAESLSRYLNGNKFLGTLIYNNNPQGLYNILLTLARSNQTLTYLNISECGSFDSIENIEAITILFKSNRTLKHLDISRNSFNNISQSSSSFFNALSLNQSIEYLNISSTCSTHADINLFPVLGKFFKCNSNPNNNEIVINNNSYSSKIKSLIVSNNFPFPDPNLYQTMDFISSNQQLITHLDLSNLRLTDEKFKPIIISLLNNSTSKSILKSLNVSINRLRSQSSADIAKYLENNKSLENLNLGLNFLREGVIKISNSLVNNTSLKILNLYATQINSKESKSICKLLAQNKTITELDIGLNIDIDPVLNYLSETPESSIKILHIGSTSLKKTFLKLISKNQSISTLDISGSTFSNLSYKSLNLIHPLLKSKSITKLNFNIEDLNSSKNSKLKIKYYPNKYYYFNK